MTVSPPDSETRDSPMSQTLFELRGAIRRIAAMPLRGETVDPLKQAGIAEPALLREAVELARLALLYADG